MKPSPLGSKILSTYAVVFAGIAPLALIFGGIVSGGFSIFLVEGLGIRLVGNLALSSAIIYYGVRVFAGTYTAVNTLAILVTVHYLGLTATNIWNFNEFPDGSRAAEMALPRIIRGVFFAAIYVWYYLLRSRTKAGFFKDDDCSNSE